MGCSCDQIWAKLWQNSASALWDGIDSNGSRWKALVLTGSLAFFWPRLWIVFLQLRHDAWRFLFNFYCHMAVALNQWIGHWHVHKDMPPFLVPKSYAHKWPNR